jgi:hypothetical protein
MTDSEQILIHPMKTFCVILLICFSVPAQHITFKATPVSYGGPYSNFGCYQAVWVTDSNNVFIKTLDLNVFALPSRIVHLVKWVSMSGWHGEFGSALDGLTSATKFTPYKETAAVWDCKDKNGQFVPHGNYRVYVEFTEDNSADSGEHLGPWMFLSFQKGDSDLVVAKPDTDFFTGISLTYSATGIGVKGPFKAIRPKTFSSVMSSGKNMVIRFGEICGSPKTVSIVDCTGKMIFRTGVLPWRSYITVNNSILGFGAHFVDISEKNGKRETVGFMNIK